MSWTPDLIIGELRPWPDSVRVVRGDTDEAKRYVPERACRFITVIDQDPSRRHRGNICECSECGHRYARGFIVDEHLKFCPECGAKVVDPREKS